jgi:hypothetical protein
VVTQQLGNTPPARIPKPSRHMQMVQLKLERDSHSSNVYNSPAGANEPNQLGHCSRIYTLHLHPSVHLRPRHRPSQHCLCHLQTRTQYPQNNHIAKNPAYPIIITTTKPSLSTKHMPTWLISLSFDKPYRIKHFTSFSTRISTSNASLQWPPVEVNHGL